MRRTVQILIASLVAIVALFAFVTFFPEIWGEVVYPLEFRSEILASSEEFDVDRNLIAAIIYSESHFNPNAGSHAGAQGLMQLIPSTARGVARQIGFSDYTDSMILNPGVNIRLGTAYIRSQLDKYNGDVEAALAHYNGGPRAGGNYIEGKRDLLPRETQNYIRRVPSVKDAYDQIYGADWSGGTGSFQIEEEPTIVDIFRLDNLLNVLFGNTQ